MKVFKCPKCESTNVFTKKNENQTGLYCGDCGKWIKWLTKEEIRLYELQQKKEVCNDTGKIQCASCGYLGEESEWYGIEDSVGYMTKLKLHYYKFWKKLRSVAHSTLKSGNYRYTGSLLTPIENEFFGWCKTLHATLTSEDREELKDKSYTNICTLRNMFFSWKKEQEVDKNV